jgi:hypothetical protein
MTASGTRSGSRADPTPTFSERLGVPLWWWFVAAFLVLLLGAEFAVGLPMPAVVITYLVFTGAAASLLIFAGSVRVQVRPGTLTAGRATLPLEYAGEVRLLDRPALRALLGPQADPAAWTVTRPWVKEGVAVVVSDPADDTPYWLIGSRRPAELAAMIAAARTGSLPAAPASPASPATGNPGA